MHPAGISRDGLGTSWIPHTPDKDGDQSASLGKQSREEAWAAARSAEESAHADRMAAIAGG